ncbi:MAG TPA: TonB family protein [Hyphomicrobiaceae bacterium]|nr:TonB family protein [Hyphomicrobiaceae bacterium]
MHAVGLAAIAICWARTETGAIERPSEAITVEVIESTVLESVRPDESRQAAASAATAAPQEGDPNAEAEQITEPAKSDPIWSATAVHEIPKAEAAHEPEPDFEPQPTTTPEEVSEAEPAEAPPKETEVDQKPVENDEVLPKPQRESKARKAVQRHGGATSKATAGQAPSSGRASASQGSILTYAAQVRASIARNKPAGNSYRGTVIIAFGVTASGGLAYAHVAKSSAIAALDRLALSTVHRAAPFPQPPPGASARQLRFSIALQFQ